MWRTVTFVGLTAVFIGYLSVWLPGPAVGLSFLGVELGEWIKFMGVGGARNWFYLPPITLGWSLALLSVGWQNGRWQTWAWRGLALAVSLLSFPAIAAILDEPPSEWLLRLLLIGSVGMLAGLTAVWPRHLPHWPIIVVLGVIGAVMPTWFYFQVRPLVANAVGVKIGVGMGVWLNGAGHLLLAAAVWLENRGSSYWLLDNNQ